MLRTSIEFKGITKHFPGVLANDDINLSINHGEIHGLLGENGAGKTTLMSILFGLLKADAGEILMDGLPVNFVSPADALNRGIALVQQHLSLVPTFTVAENFALGTKGEFWKPAQKLENLINNLAERYDLRVDPNAIVGELTLGARQRVELLKLLFRDAKVIILDEPTAVLAPDEIKSLFTVLKELASDGRSIVLISHKIHELMDVCDRITVLRSGRVMDTLAIQDARPKILIRLMIDHDLDQMLPTNTPDRANSPIIAELKSCSVKVNQRHTLDSVSLKVRSREILGVAGVEGNGQNELTDLLSGALQLNSGQYFVNGVDLSDSKPLDVLKQGVRVVPEDRHAHGVILDMSLQDNLVLSKISNSPFSKSGFLQNNNIKKHANTLVDQFDIITPGISVQMRKLSGGNQQKAVLARELSGNFVFLVAHNPTRGLDVAAQISVRNLLVKAKNSGAGVLLVSSDLDEIIQLSDRIIVMVGGAIAGQLVGDDISIDKIGELIGGLSKTNNMPEPVNSFEKKDY